MAASMSCCVCHIAKADGEAIVPYSDTSWSTLLDCLNVWATLDGTEREVASQFDYSARETGGFHRRCYQRITDKRRIQCALKRKEKGCLRLEVDPEQVPSPKKPLLRSQILPSSHGRSQYVLPPECLICCKIKTIRDKSSCKRKIEKLVTCETDAAKLLEAARFKKDQRILLKVGDLDPVSIEVRYHASCYKLYTRCVYEVEADTTDRDTYSKPLSKSFDVFCTEVVDKRLIFNEEILKISHLTELFVRIVNKTEGIDISNYRNCQLKAKLQARYSNLEYIQPKSKCCELVFYQKEGKSSVINIPCSDDETESDSDCELDEGELFFPSSENSMTQDDFAQLYRSALIIRASISSCPGVDTWPPNASDMTLTACEKIIPAELLNFVMWCCGITDDFSTEKLHFHGQDNEKKVLSVAQDIITLATQGRTLMPKHLALGMTIRHLTGSAKLQQLLNSFGHCVSHSVTLEHDTALAVQQLHRDSEVPPGFRSEEFTTLVWDNNDFGEETLTGKGTTHNTNGIIIQAALSDSTLPLEKTNSLCRDRKRTVEAPQTFIFPYHGPKRKGPSQFQDQNVDIARKENDQKSWRLIDLAIFLAKYSQAEALLPSWTGCNQLLCKDSHPLSNIGYLPVIDASPTDKATVQTILDNSLKIADTLNLPSVVVVMDQAIYSKAQEIRWQGRPEYHDRIVLRLGEFHTAMAFLGAVGKRFEHAGLRDVAIESGIVAEGSVGGVMNGHQFNRSMRCHKIMADALNRLRLQEYMTKQEAEHVESITDLMQMTQDTFNEKLSRPLQNEVFVKFVQDFQDYVNRRSRENAMYSFWTSYLEMVELLLLFVRATREGNWNLHLSAIREMIPWFFAYGRINYSRYLPVYYLEMTNLHKSHPFVQSNLQKGMFAVKRHDNHGFAMTACDQVIEQTFNRDSKTRGGMTGITRNKGAVRRWILSHPERASIANMCYAMSSTHPQAVSSQNELTKSRVNTDELAVQDVISTVSNYGNPFSCEDEEIFNLSSGKIAPDVIKSDLLSAHEKGEKCFQKFVTERLTSDQKDLFDPLPLPPLQTFLHVDNNKKPKSQEASLKEDRQMLSRLLIVAQEKGLVLKDVLKFQLSSVPRALANSDGSLVKTSKASLLHEIEKQVSSDCVITPLDLPKETVLIIDAMVVIQQQRFFPETFGQFAVSILKQVVGLGLKYNAKRVDFVADRYPAVSIKQAEREKRSANGETRVRIWGPDQKMPNQMKKFLLCSANKEALVSFLVSEWEACANDLLHGVEMYVTVGESCKRLCVLSGKIVSEDVPPLHCDHEEADTRMLLHAAHAAKNLPRQQDIIIVTVDTDVFILSLWASTKIENRLILSLNAPNKAKLLDMKMMSLKLGDNVVSALVGFHPFTGCDSTSAFRGKGKVKPLKILISNPRFIKAFHQLGQEWTVPDHVKEDLELFVCHVYGLKESVCVDEARYESFRLGNVSEHCMPPNRNSLQFHMLRSNYQAYIYRSSFRPYISAKRPEENGWMKSPAGLSIKWRDMDVAPSDVLQSVTCKCVKTACDSARCSCKKSNMTCTDMCHCRDCKNQDQCESDSDDNQNEC